MSSKTLIDESLELQLEAKKIGLDWIELDKILDKIREETDELDEAIGNKNQEHIIEEFGDLFFLESNAEGIGDARNIDAIIRLQEKNLINSNSGSFKDIFSEIVTSVGSSVRSSEITKNAAEGMRDAAIEGDLSYSGVNLDEEAASLMEFQQAYQASARILSTAREMFNSLLDVI